MSYLQLIHIVIVIWEIAILYTLGLSPSLLNSSFLHLPLTTPEVISYYLGLITSQHVKFEDIPLCRFQETVSKLFYTFWSAAPSLVGSFFESHLSAFLGPWLKLCAKFKFFRSCHFWVTVLWSARDWMSESVSRRVTFWFHIYINRFFQNLFVSV